MCLIWLFFLFILAEKPEVSPSTFVSLQTLRMGFKWRHDFMKLPFYSERVVLCVYHVGAESRDVSIKTRLGCELHRRQNVNATALLRL